MDGVDVYLLMRAVAHMPKHPNMCMHFLHREWLVGDILIMLLRKVCHNNLLLLVTHGHIHRSERERGRERAGERERKIVI